MALLLVGLKVFASSFREKHKLDMKSRSGSHLAILPFLLQNVQHLLRRRCPEIQASDSGAQRFDGRDANPVLRQRGRRCHRGHQAGRSICRARHGRRTARALPRCRRSAAREGDSAGRGSGETEAPEEPRSARADLHRPPKFQAGPSRPHARACHETSSSNSLKYEQTPMDPLLKYKPKSPGHLIILPLF